MAHLPRVSQVYCCPNKASRKSRPRRASSPSTQAASEILARQDKLDDAVALLKQGIEKIPPTQGLDSLYQMAGAALALQGKLEPAIDLLCDGIQKVPARAGYKITERALLLAAASRRRNLLEKVTALCTEPQTSLGAALSKLLDDSCLDAADLLSEARRQFPRYFMISMLEVLSHLGAADPKAAREALSRLPSHILYGEGLASTLAGNVRRSPLRRGRGGV